jgi:hypothetical protein
MYWKATHMKAKETFSYQLSHAKTALVHREIDDQQTPHFMVSVEFSSGESTFFTANSDHECVCKLRNLFGLPKTSGVESLTSPIDIG